jgi:hypothetical protein
MFQRNVLHLQLQEITVATGKNQSWWGDSMVWVHGWTIPTERPQLVGEVSAKFVDRGFHVVSAMDPYGRILQFLDQSHYFIFQAAPQLYSRGWVDLIPDPLLLSKSECPELNLDLWMCSQELWPLDHRASHQRTWLTTCPKLGGWAAQQHIPHDSTLLVPVVRASNPSHGPF